MVKLRSKTDEHRVSGPTWKYVCFKTWAYFIQGHLHPVPAEAAGLFLKTLDSFYPGSASSCVCGSCRFLSKLPPVCFILRFLVGSRKGGKTVAEIEAGHAVCR